ncbi:MAG TPA: glycosyltransferase family 39 protein [Vicinamibacteria bacterium]
MTRASAAVALAALVALGCLRPALPELLLERWGAAVLLLAALTSAALFRYVRSRDRAGESVLFAVFPLALGALYLQPQRVASDGIFYFAPLRSVVVDFDLDFENEYRVLGAAPGYFQRTETGRLPNNYSVGPAFLWLPAYLIAHVLGFLGLYRPTGFGYPYFTAVATASAVGGFAGVLFVFRLLREYFDERAALPATLLVWLATFHVWYMVFEPSMSHAFAMASVSGLLLLAHRGIRGARSFFLAGAASGLVALVRWQNVVFVPAALAVGLSKGERPRPRDLLLAAIGFLLVLTPQLVYWKLLYGTFLLVPQGGGYVDLGSPRIEEVLFSSRHGLLSWAPVLWLALAGLPRFVRRAPALGGALVVSTLLALYVNASVFDWWAGASFGSRRFDGALPFFALGLAASLEWLLPRIERRPLLALSLLLAPFALWNFLLMGVYFEGAIPPDGPASFQQAAADGAALVYRRTGYLFSWPGAVRDFLLHGRPLAVYDLAGSGTVSNNVDIRMGDTDALFLGRGWSLPRRARGRTFREASPGGAEVYVSLAESAPYEIALEGEAGAAAVVVLNGADLGELSLDAEGRGALEVAPTDIWPGINQIVLGTADERGLALSRITLTRPGDANPRK